MSLTSAMITTMPCGVPTLTSMLSSSLSVSSTQMAILALPT